jgi:hypothetical protein
MGNEVGVNWKIKVKSGDFEVEVVGMNPDTTKKWFDELEKKYLSST